MRRVEVDRITLDEYMNLAGFDPRLASPLTLLPGAVRDGDDAVLMFSSEIKRLGRIRENDLELQRMQGGIAAEADAKHEAERKAEHEEAHRRWLRRQEREKRERGFEVARAKAAGTRFA